MKLKFITFAVLTTLILAACAPATPIVPTPDVLAVRTSAAYTVVAEFTLTAAAFTPTPMPTETPLPTPEPPTETPTGIFTTDPTQAALGTPASLCDNYVFVGDVTIVDGTTMTAGQDFVKTWTIKNTGDCTWGDGYMPIYSYGGEMGGQPVPLGVVVPPGGEVNVSVNFKAPTAIGEYSSYWQMVNPKGISFGTKENTLFVKIVVQ
jgi:hypothetical protein